MANHHQRRPPGKLKAIWAQRAESPALDSSSPKIAKGTPALARNPIYYRSRLGPLPIAMSGSWPISTALFHHGPLERHRIHVHPAG